MNPSRCSKRARNSRRSVARSSRKRKCRSKTRWTAQMLTACRATPKMRSTLTKPTSTSEGRERLDVAVASRLACSRRHAQALILAGRVHVGSGGAVLKAGSLVASDAAIEILDDARFVSRGAMKLERALDDFSWSVEGLRCLDVGASTGGFTDCLLQRGAASVTAVDVGYGQLAWKLRSDPRVIVYERSNFRHADVAAMGAPFAFACADVSFISLSKLASNLAAALEDHGHLVVLVKPQFEVGRGAVGKG